MPKKFYEMLKQQMLEFAINFPDDCRFQQDNVPSNRAKVKKTRKWLQKHNLNVLEWSSYSSHSDPEDQNFYQNYWDLKMLRRVKNPKFAQ